MAKDPAFLFYPNDFIGGTMGMTLEEKGAYLELLILQFNKGAFTIEQAKRALGEKFQNLWPHIIDKFSEVSGSYHNPRLKEEIEKRKSYSASRRKNREKKDMNNICVTYDKDMIKTGDTNVKTYVPHMENENENRNKDVNEDKGGVGEKEETLIPILLNIFSSKNRTYIRDQERDFPEMLKIIMFLSDGRLPVDKDPIINRWKGIVDFVSSHNFYRNYSIKQINTHIQNILQAKENGKNTGNTQKSDAGKQLINSTGFGKLRSH